ncbi:hypothetical protein, partial [Actinomyces massiliensis]|uniref:hypothetical protein n=1 Tax=Actinomyces massiliensis TaxID=461393 RepID=UPI0028E22B7E
PGAPGFSGVPGHPGPGTRIPGHAGSSSHVSGHAARPISRLPGPIRPIPGFLDHAGSFRSRRRVFATLTRTRGVLANDCT